MGNAVFGTILKSELNRRLAANQSFSLRAFARSLSMDPSTLSKLMSGQRKAGPKAQAKLLKKLGVELDSSAEYFSLIGQGDQQEIHEWYDTAILEQLTVTGFRATKKSLARVFGLSEFQIESSLERLQKQKLVEVSKSGRVRDFTSGQTTNIVPATTSAAKRQIQRQFLEKAMQSIDRDPLELRDMTTITCAIDPDRIPEAKERIRAFRRELAEFLTSGRKSKRVFNVSIALYPITNEHKENLK